RSPRDAVRRGIGYCPEDRKKEGIVADLSIRENIVLALQVRRGWWRSIGKTKQRQIADSYIEQLGIKAPDAEQPIGLLSGGRQPMNRIKAALQHPLVWPCLTLVLLVLLDLSQNAHFLSVSMLDGHWFGAPIDILNRAAPLVLVSLGMTLVIATRGIDISVG